MVIQSNGLDTIIICLEDFDSGVKEAAAWALGYIARHNKSLAQTTVDAGIYIALYKLIIFFYINYLIHRSCATFGFVLART